MYFGIAQTTTKNTTDKIYATKYPNIAQNYLTANQIEGKPYFIPGKDEALTYLSPVIAGVIGILSSGQTSLANNIVVKDVFSQCTVNWLERERVSDYQNSLLLFMPQQLLK